MNSQKPRFLKSAAISAVVLVVGAIVCWKAAQPPKASSAPLTAETGRGSETPPSITTSNPRQQDASVPIDESRAAHVSFAGATHVLTPNIRGEFPRMLVPASATITAAVPFAEAEPGEVIPVQAEDGGLLQDTAAQGSVTVDNEHKVNVTYQVSANDGMHRVTLRRGGESRVLEFWVGAEAPVLARK